MTALQIPEEWRELSQAKAAEIAGVPKTSFRRKHIDDGCTEPITISKRPDGSEYIAFDEVYRLYREVATQNLRALTSGQTGPKTKTQNGFSGPLQTVLKNTMDQTEKDPYMKVRVSEFVELQKNLAKAQAEASQLKDQATKAEDRANKYYGDLQSHMKQLEDKRQKETEYRSEISEIKTLLAIQQQERKLSWWERLFKGSASTSANKNEFPATQKAAEGLQSEKG